MSRKAPIHSSPFGLSLSKPLVLRGLPFDELRANGSGKRVRNRPQTGLEAASNGVLQAACRAIQYPCGVRGVQAGEVIGMRVLAVVPETVLWRAIHV